MEVNKQQTSAQLGTMQQQQKHNIIQLDLISRKLDCKSFLKVASNSA